MKKQRILALVLALCLCLSLGFTASAEELEKAPDKSGSLVWELDQDGTLKISGNGKLEPFTSAEDQPWAAVREEIKAIRFDHRSHLDIASVAYWFAGCVNLESCEVPAFAALGTDAFRDCDAMEILMLYHNSDIPVIADTAFQCEDGQPLTVVVLDEMVCEAMTSADFSGRDVELIVRPPISSYAVCGIEGCNCSSCSWTYDYEYKDEDSHYKWEVCTKCSANVYHIRIANPHQFNSSGYCSLCGYEESCSHYNTRTRWSGCDWEEYCVDCGEILDWGTTHGAYSYGAWEYYTTSQHRRYGTCNDCGEGKYQYGSHSTMTKYEKHNETQHSVISYCSTCASNVGSASYADHTYSYGSWASASDTQHKRTRTCFACGYSDEEYANHNFSYGSWTDYSQEQHRRAKSCSCGYSSYEYGGHTDGNGDGNCDACGRSMTRFSVTVPITMPLAMSKNGEVSGAEVGITNNSTGAVSVTRVTVTAENGWKLAPYNVNMAAEKVDTKQIGFYINGSQTTAKGSTEELDLASPWEIEKDTVLTLDYDAVISATSQAIDQQVLTVTFVLAWA